MDKPLRPHRLFTPYVMAISALTGRFDRQTARLRAAFTLVEMLVVLGIIVLILSVAVPVLRGVLGARGISNSVDVISGYLTNARIQAMSQNTYVVVGFYQAQGSDDLQMQAVKSLSGTLDTKNFSGGSSALTAGALTYRALGPIVHLPNVTLTPYANLVPSLKTKLTNAGVAPNPPTQTGDPANIVIPDTPTNPGNSSNGLEFTFGSTAVNTIFNWYLIAFTPQGEALYFPTAPTFTGNTTVVPNTIPYYGELFIGVTTSRGGSIPPNDYTARAITIDGGSGSINVYSL